MKLLTRIILACIATAIAAWAVISFVVGDWTYPSNWSFMGRLSLVMLWITFVPLVWAIIVKIVEDVTRG